MAVYIGQALCSQLLLSQKAYFFYYAAPARQCHPCNAVHSCRCHRLASALSTAPWYSWSIGKIKSWF